MHENRLRQIEDTGYEDERDVRLSDEQRVGNGDNWRRVDERDVVFGLDFFQKLLEAYTADKFVRTLVKGEHIKDGDPRFGGVDYTTGDYTVDEKDKTCALTEDGIAKCERYFKIDNFSDPENMDINHHVNIALKAHAIMKRDIDYIEHDGEIVIVDEFTGRLMFGRRYSDGLHQAIEAKESR